ncbi:ABC transporter permease [Pseudomonas chengduensis]|nr:ABC transporter permease [Pseudomonas chengduensis]MDH1866524.1 ABC transporter permease [Pseudomonas chengduensis]
MNRNLLWRNKLAALGWRLLLGGGIWLAFIALALTAPWLAPHDPNAQDLHHTLLPPMWSASGLTMYPLGTDLLGRCILSRLWYGSQVTVLVALCAALGAALLGTLLGLLAGYHQRWVDRSLMTLVDIWMAFPSVVLAMLLMVALGAGLLNVILAIVLVDWTRFCRVIRSETLVWRRQDFVQAARLSGASHWAVMMNDLLPILRPTLAVLISLEMATAIMAESILSFVGISVSSDTPSWGAMIAQALQSAFSAPWQLIPPIIAIVVSIFAAMLLGTGIRFSRHEQTATGHEVLV